MRLVALRPFTYATRRLQAGEAFDANSRDARLLLAIKKAKPSDERPPAVIPPPPPALIEQAAAVTPQVEETTHVDLAPNVDAMAQLRAEAESLGVAVSKRWAEKRLRDEIAKARQA